MIKNELVRTMNLCALSKAEMAKKSKIGIERLDEILSGEVTTLKETNDVCVALNLDLFDAIGVSEDWYLNLEKAREKKEKDWFDIIMLFKKDKSAERMAVAQYEMIEIGEKKLTYNQLMKICIFLDITVYQLLGIEEKE